MSLRPGTRYRIWSYVPDPAPAELTAAPGRYPGAADRFLTVWRRHIARHSLRRVARSASKSLFADPSSEDLAAYRVLYDQAREVGAGATSPYAAVLALESWFRQRGGFTYEEQPAVSDGPALVHFVTTSRAGYCQHFAGAMAVMARLLGIPARVAVGFTSGRYEDGGWTVSDHNAHAWVEAWFPGHGWVPFDPTPGRGRFSAQYSFASNSAETVDALRRGALDSLTGADSRRDLPEDGSTLLALPERDEPPSILAVALALGLVVAVAIGTLKWAVRRLSYFTTDPRRTAAASRRELESFLRDQGVAVPKSATLAEVGRVATDELGFDASDYVSAAGRARFGVAEAAPSAATSARSELQVLLRKVRGGLSLRARVRGFVSLRSLRGWQG